MTTILFPLITQPLSHNYMLTDSFVISIPFTSTARIQAQEFAQEQANSTRQRQVYRNTLAVHAVNTYLQWMEVTTDLDRSWSWQAGKRFCLDIADLYLPGIGRLECRPVEAGQTHCQIPTEVQTHRIGYVAVELDETGYEAKLLGFRAIATAEAIPLEQFNSLDNLLMALEPIPVRIGDWLTKQLESHWVSLQFLAGPDPMVAYLPSANVLSPTDYSTQVTKLLQQLDSTRDEEARWKVIEKLWTIAPEHPATGVRRGVDLGLYLGGAAVALMMAILPNPDGRLSILLRVYPMRQVALPDGLALAGMYESGASFIEVQSRKDDNYIQVKFLAEPGERFGVRVTLGEAEFIEHFLI